MNIHRDIKIYSIHACTCMYVYIIVQTMANEMKID